jgi:DNA-3-methyladenine glycosylase I
MNKLIKRCDWCLGYAEHIKYHDEEWGVPLYDDHKHFEFLVLEAAQAGLSWLTVLKKRENYRKAFDQFDPQKVARYTEARKAKLLNNPGIIRNQLKIESAIHNAKLFLDVQKKYGSFTDYFWDFVNGKPVVNKWKSIKQVPPRTVLSDTVSKDLKQKGFKFVGSTVIYAHLQAAGLVNDHLVTCFRYKEVKNN